MRRYSVASVIIVTIIGFGAAYGPFTLPYARPANNVSEDAAVTPTSGRTIAERFKLSKSSETFKIVQAAERLPRIYEATINPPDVQVGDIQRFEIVVAGPDPIVSVEAHMELDHGSKVVPLKLQGEVAVRDMAPNPYYVDKEGKLAIAKDGPKIALVANAESYSKLKYVGEWKVEDTHVAMYRTTLIVKDAAGRVNDVTLEWSDAVCDIPLGGSWTSVADCSLAHDDGTDSGGDITLGSLDDITLGTYDLYVTGTVTIGTGSLIISTGHVYVGGSYIWVYDDDTDGYIDDTMSIAAQTSDPGANWERKYSRTAWGDCLDTDADVYQTSPVNVVDDTDQDSYYVGTSGSQCVGGSTTVSTRTYYKDTGGVYGWLNPGTGGTSGDCNDDNQYVYRNVTVTQESDQDGYGATAYSSQCVGASATTGFGNFTHYKNTSNVYYWADNAYNTSDCNDNSLNLYQSFSDLASDVDNDGYYTGSGSSICVGSSVTINGKPFYDRYGTLTVYDVIRVADARGGSDCDVNNAKINVTSGATARDNNADGYVQESALHSQCVGYQYTTVSGREYYRASDGCYYWLRGYMTLGYNDAADGTTCRTCGSQITCTSGPP